MAGAVPQHCHAQGNVLFKQQLLNTPCSQVFPLQVPQEDTFAYLRCRGLAELRCRMPWMCFSKECSDSATMRRGDTVRSLSSLVHSRGGEAGWTVLLPHNSTGENRVRPGKLKPGQSLIGPESEELIHWGIPVLLQGVLKGAVSVLW